ncbi:MAG: Holliday junction branch migration protein RuvA [Parcubacteria group bacterium]|nr:Holliday junction branch migration protein RuvA [Parcubacteria group bacterium]
MISSLQGVVLEKLAMALLLDVHGVGYEVRVTPRLWQAAHAGQDLRVYTHFQVREDAQVLYGFSDLHERDTFRQLLSVNGVGPKIAMAVLSAATPDEVIRAVQTEDTAALKAPGVGPKIVKRIIVELKAVFGEAVVHGSASKPSSANNSLRQDLFSALGHLGYADHEIEQLMHGADIEGLTVQQALKQLLQKGRE